MSRKSGFVTNLGRSKLCAAVGVVIAAIFRLAHTSQQGGGGWGVFLLSVYSSAFLTGADLCYFLSAILESSDFFIIV